MFDPNFVIAGMAMFPIQFVRVFWKYRSDFFAVSKFPEIPRCSNFQMEQINVRHEVPIYKRFVFCSTIFAFQNHRFRWTGRTLLNTFSESFRTYFKTFGKSKSFQNPSTDLRPLLWTHVESGRSRGVSKTHRTGWKSHRTNLDIGRQKTRKHRTRLKVFQNRLALRTNL